MSSSPSSYSPLFIKDDSMPSPTLSQRQQYDNRMTKSVSYSSENDDENNKNNNPVERFGEQRSASAFDDIMNGM